MSKTLRIPLGVVLLVLTGAISLVIVLTGELRSEIVWLVSKPSGHQPGLSRPVFTQTSTPTPQDTVTPSPTSGTTPDPNGTSTIPALFDVVGENGVFGGAEGIAFVSDRDGNPEIYSLEFSDYRITRLTYSDMADFHPRWSPDGRWLTFTSYRDGGPDIHIMTATGALRQSLTAPAWFDEFPAWSPDGEWLIFDSNRPDPETPNSQSEENEFRLFRMRTDGSELQTVLADARDGAVGTYSPNGAQIVFQSRGGEGEYQIYTYDMATGSIVRLTHTLARNFRPSWSPDGQQIAFVSERDGQGAIYIMNADGTNQRRLTGENLNHVRGPVWSPDGEWILFNAEVDGNTDIYVMNLSGSELYRLTMDSVEDYHPDWRPQYP